ncbi:MAG: toll/interleukin-1 receptor domain-containing protein [Rhodomicrobium sp.]|jgi:hypothetical protein
MAPGDKELPVVTVLIIAAASALLIFGLYKFNSWRSRRKAELRERILRGETLPGSTPGLAKHAVFISYRKADSRDITERIHDKLTDAFGKQTVFKDIDAIGVAADFRKEIFDSLKICRVFLAILGRDWKGGLSDCETSRIDNPDDIMRIEIETALKRKIPVVPVLVQGSEMPAEKSLPESLRDIASRQAVRVRPDPDFHKDMERIVAFIRTKLR